MNTEPIILSVVGQKEKNKHCMLTQIYGVEDHVGGSEHPTASLPEAASLLRTKGKY